MTSYSNWYHLGLSLLTLFVVIVTTTLHLLAWFPTEVTKDVFSKVRVDTLLIRGEPMMVGDWLGWLWAVLYAYQMIMCIYASSVFCRHFEVQRLLRQAIYPTVLLAFCLTLSFTIAWLFLAEFSAPEHPHYFCGLALLGTAIIAHVAYSLALGSGNYVKSLLQILSPCDVIMLRILVYNCLAAHAAWLMISVFLDVARVLGHYTTLPQETIQYLWLGAVTGYIFFLFLVEVACSSCALEFTVTPYAIALIALGSVIANDRRQAVKNPKDDAQENVTLFVTIALMCLLGLLFFIAMGVAIRKNRRTPEEDTEETAPLKKVTNMPPETTKVNNLVSYDAEPKHYTEQNKSFLYKKE